jgi:hypothetical protein
MKTSQARAVGGRRAEGRLGGSVLVQGVLVGLAFCACHSSVPSDAKTASNADADQIKEFDRPLEAPAVKPEAPASDFKVEEYALLGARHDLTYSGPKQATCQCLAVALSDKVSDPAFQWAMTAPRLEPTTQWVIAFSSNGVPCDAAPQGTLGASYQGYSVEGSDVVVYVEALADGRPMTNGAIIPRPLGTGSVFIEPAGAIYGRPLDGRGKRCRLKAPDTAPPSAAKPPEVIGNPAK